MLGFLEFQAEQIFFLLASGAGLFKPLLTHLYEDIILVACQYI